MHDHVYSTHRLFSSFSKELYLLAVESLLIKLINKCYICICNSNFIRSISNTSISGEGVTNGLGF